MAKFEIYDSYRKFTTLLYSFTQMSEEYTKDIENGKEDECEIEEFTDEEYFCFICLESKSEVNERIESTVSSNLISSVMFRKVVSD